MLIILEHKILHKFLFPCCFYLGFPGGSDSKIICLQCWRPWFNPWVGKIPWRRKWQPTAVFLPGQSYEQRSVEGWQRVGHDWVIWGHSERTVASYRHKGNLCFLTCLHISQPQSWSCGHKVWYSINSNGNRLLSLTDFYLDIIFLYLCWFISPQLPTTPTTNLDKVKQSLLAHLANLQLTCTPETRVAKNGLLKSMLIPNLFNCLSHYDVFQN